MNTRLQVEHPVTEEIAGVDLVEWQLRVASGEPLPMRQDELAIDGWAMEARLYAEDPARGFLPSTGRLERCHFPQGQGRIETGVEQGSEISPFYDPMIAKIVVHADSRDNAAALLKRKLEGLALWPVKTNAAFLLRAVDHPQFLAGDVTTGFIAEHQAALIPSGSPGDLLLGQAAWCIVQAQADGGPLAGSGFRLNAAPCRTVHVRVDGHDHIVEADREPVEQGVSSSSLGRDGALVTFEGQTFGVFLKRTDSRHGPDAGSGAILSSMPGRVVAVDVVIGQAVAKGQKLLTLEAMKMEHVLAAPFDGIVAELNVAAGGQVQVDALLARIVERDEQGPAAKP